MPGPPKKPTRLKELAGNPGGRPLNDQEAPVPPGQPDMPVFADPAAAEVWRALVPQLCAVGLARKIDGYALERYCVLFAEWRRMQAKTAKSDPYYVEISTKKGKPVVTKAFEYPWSRMLRDLSNTLTRLEREFGLTPAARSSIRIGQEGKAKGDLGSLREEFLDTPSLKITGQAS